MVFNACKGVVDFLCVPNVAMCLAAPTSASPHDTPLKPSTLWGRWGIMAMNNKIPYIPPSLIYDGRFIRNKFSNDRVSLKNQPKKI